MIFNLKNKGNYVPSMLVDLDLLDKNIAALKQQLNPNVDYRIVAKSLPSPSLLGYIMEKANTNRLMVFHQPFLTALAIDYPQTDILMGKPMPVKAAEVFYQKLSNKALFNPKTQLQWLIDSEERLVQYLALAKQQNTLLQVNIEIDVGLHRGGLQQAEELDSLLKIIDNNTIYWLNYFGSGNESAAHLLEDDRMTMMFCAFEGDALILRLYCRVEVIQEKDKNWNEYVSHFENEKGARQVFVLHIESVNNSCGWGVPLYDFVAQRDTLSEYFENSTKEDHIKYMKKNNQISFDGKETNLFS